MEFYIYKSRAETKDLGFLLKIKELFPLHGFHFFDNPSDCTQELLLSLKSPKSLILFIEKILDVEMFASAKSLISDIPIFIILISQDRSLRRLCQKIRPKMICYQEDDLDDFIQVIREISNHKQSDS